MGNLIRIGLVGILVLGLTPHSKADFMPSIINLLLSDNNSPALSLSDGIRDLTERVGSEVRGAIVASEESPENSIMSISPALASEIEIGQIVAVQPNADPRFPLGFSGKLVNKTVSSNGDYNVEFEEPLLPNVASSAKLAFRKEALSRASLITIISPSAVQPANPKQFQSLSKSVSGGAYNFREGAITVGQNNSGLQSKASVQNGGDIIFDIKLNLSDLSQGLTENDTTPGTQSGSAGFLISGGLRKIRFTNELDFSVSTGLKALNLALEGDLDFEVKFSGEGKLKIGYFSKAWEEVEKASLAALGFSSSLTGLSSDDKIGKFPLAGLVYSLPCPQGCPVLSGTSNAAIQSAKPVGVIVWIYLDLAGSFELTGDLSFAELSNSALKIGMTKVPGGELDTNFSLRPNGSSGNMMEILKLDGSYTSSFNAGITSHVDVFLYGVRIANQSLQIGSEVTATVSGSTSYGTIGLNSPWSWSGDFCVNANVGVGAKYSAETKFGLAIETAWSESSVGFEYTTKVPTDAEASTSGQHGLWNTNSQNTCPNPCKIERYKLRVAEARPDYANASTKTVLDPSEAFAVENGEGLLVGLTREGIQVETQFGYFIDHYFPTVERSSADVDFGEHLVRINDDQNNCRIAFPLNLTIKNSAYRKLVGKSYTFSSPQQGTYTATFEPDGTINGISNGGYDFSPLFFGNSLSCDGTQIETLGSVRVYANFALPPQLAIGESSLSPHPSCQYQIE